MNVLFLSHNYGPIKNALFIDCFVLILEAVSYFRNTTPGFENEIWYKIILEKKYYSAA
jgi:hypothetical protein